MIIEYEFDLSYKNSSCMWCFDYENTLVFIDIKQDEENRLICFYILDMKMKHVKYKKWLLKKPLNVIINLFIYYRIVDI